MGSRRRKPADRSSTRVAGVFRQPRGGGAAVEFGDGMAVIGPTTSSGGFPALERPGTGPHTPIPRRTTSGDFLAVDRPPSVLPQPAGPPPLPRAEEPGLSSAEATGASSDHHHRARQPASGKHKIGLVTRQTEDGSYELVYADLDEEAEESDAIQAPPTPFLRRKPVQYGLLGGVVVLVVAGVLGVALTGGDDTRKVTRSTVELPDDLGKGKKRYEYVAPGGDGNKVDLTGDDEEGDEAARPRVVTPRPDPTPEHEEEEVDGMDEGGGGGEPPPEPHDSLNRVAPPTIPTPDVVNPQFRFQPPQANGLGVRPGLNNVREDLLPDLADRLHAGAEPSDNEGEVEGEGEEPEPEIDGEVDENLDAPDDGAPGADGLPVEDDNVPEEEAP